MINHINPLREAQLRALQTPTTRSGWKISFSGTANEKANRNHYKNLVSLAITLKGFPNTDALVLGAGAGYPSFYLAMYGLQGRIDGEDIDPDSVTISRVLTSYFGYPDVQKTFLKEGLAKARDLVSAKVKQGVEPKPLDNLLFNCRDSTEQKAIERTYPIIVCDNLHNPEVIRDERKLQDLLFRLNDLSAPGTFLSYRYGTETYPLRRFGFENIATNILQKR